MNTRIPRAFVLTASLLTGATASAAGSTIPIDSEQKATSAFVAALMIGQEPPLLHQYAMANVIALGQRALQAASQATTPVALMATPAGVNIPCPTSGSVSVRMAPRIPRVFKFEWKQCHYPLDGADQSLNGSGEIVLLSDSFTPDRVASIRLGSANSNVLHVQEWIYPGFSSRNVVIDNFLVVGSIPLRNLQLPLPNSFTPFTYLVNGFDDFSQTNQFGSEPAYTNSTRIDFDAVAYTGSAAYDDDASRYDADLTALFGKLTYTRRDPPPYGTNVDVFRFQGLHVHDTSDWMAAERSQTIDGRVDFTWNPNFGQGCINGSYAFKTGVPLHRSTTGFYQPYDSGQLQINGTEKLSIYSAANVPATLPTPANLTLLHIEAAGVGTFNYDVNDFLNDLRPISHCM